MNKSQEHEPVVADGSPEGSEAEKFQQETVLAATLNEVSRWKAIWNDPKIREAATAALRTLANVGVSLADVVPMFGEAPSWLADIGKFTDGWARKIGLSTDLTPDVSKSVAVGTEVLELFSGSMGPSHAIETMLQLKADWGRLRAGLERFKQLLAEEAADYESNKAEITQAMEAFEVKV